MARAARPLAPVRPRVVGERESRKVSGLRGGLRTCLGEEALAAPLRDEYSRYPARPRRHHVSRFAPLPLESSPSSLRILRGDWPLGEAAAALGCSKSHLSDVEREVKQPSRALLLRAEEVYGVQGLADRRSWRPAGRPQLRSEAEEIRRLFRARWRTRLTQPVRQEFSLALHHEVGRARLEELNSKRRPSVFWKAVKTLPRRMNSPEQGALLALLVPDGEPLELHPRDIGFPLPVVEPVGHWWLCVLVRQGDARFVVFGQLEVMSRPGQVRRLDFLVGVWTPTSRGYVVVEVDGPVHRERRPLDQAREKEIDLPFVRVQAHEVWRKDFRNYLLARVLARLEQVRPPVG